MTSKATPPSQSLSPPPQAEKFQEPKKQEKMNPGAAASAASPAAGPGTAALAGDRQKNLDPLATAILSAHNQYRAQHGVPPLAWDEDCVAAAKRCADECQANGKLTHCHMSGQLGEHGQNVAWASGAGYVKDPAAGVAQWYAEVAKYDFSKQSETQKGTGHFTQVCWRASYKVGAALSANGQFLVCNYFPAGNKSGQYAANVPIAGTTASPHRSPPRGAGARKPTPPDDSNSPATAPSTPPERQLVAGNVTKKKPQQLHGGEEEAVLGADEIAAL